MTMKTMSASEEYELSTRQEGSGLHQMLALQDVLFAHSER